MALTDFIANLPSNLIHQWGYLIVFFASFLEATPIIGLAIPGQTVVVLAGFFAKLKFLNLLNVILIVSFGAILGDFVAYSLGRHFGDSLVKRFGKFIFRKEKYYIQTKKIINAHPGKTIILGRFNSITRAIVPFVAGILKVPLINFIIYNIIGAVSWASVFVFVGYLFGKSYQIASRYFGIGFGALTILIIIVIYIYYKFMRRYFQLIVK